jgi:hypothetical protein
MTSSNKSLTKIGCLVVLGLLLSATTSNGHQIENELKNTKPE